jgi:hypothetical protein
MRQPQLVIRYWLSVISFEMPILAGISNFLQQERIRLDDRSNHK